MILMMMPIIDGIISITIIMVVTVVMMTTFYIDNVDDNNVNDNVIRIERASPVGR